MSGDFVHVFEPGRSDWTLLLLHGTGGDENDLLPLGRQLAPDVSLLSPRGKVLENGVSPRFFRRLAVGELDIPDLLERTDELAAFVGEQIDERGLDSSALVAVGISNGANIAASLLLRHPDLLRGALLLRPMLPYEPEETPHLDGVDVLIAAGDSDPFSSRDQVERLAQILGDGGADVQLSIATGAGHEITQDDLQLAHRWSTALLS